MDKEFDIFDGTSSMYISIQLAMHVISAVLNYLCGIQKHAIKNGVKFCSCV